MTSKQFLTYFFVGLASCLGLLIPLSIYSDLYGLFQPSDSRPRPVYGEERTAKYLYSFRYIPDHFQGVLFGSSTSDSLDLQSFPNHRIYNASINGGNITDLLPIAGNIYRRAEMQVTIVCMHRYLTRDHMQKTALMSPRQYWSALGSPQLIAAHLSRAAAHAGIARAEYDGNGMHLSDTEPSPAEVRRAVDRVLDDIHRGVPTVENYTIDPIALSELRDLMALAQRHSRRVLVFFPPAPAPILAAKLPEYSAYRDAITRILTPSCTLVDFNAPQYAALRNDLRNFADGTHLSTAGARQVVAELAKALATAADSASRRSLPRAGNTAVLEEH